jgi:hypothetical protein
VSGVRPPHYPELAALVKCQACHRVTCFGHWLPSFLHSAEIIQFWRSGNGPMAWHAWHKGGKERWKMLTKPGSENANDLLVRLLRAATHYKRCRPADEKRTMIGWYDEGYEVRVHPNHCCPWLCLLIELRCADDAR